MTELAAPWAVRWVLSPGYGRRVALGRAQARLFARLVSLLGSEPGAVAYTQLPTQRELAAELGTTVGRIADTLADLSRLGLVDLRTVRGCRGATFVRWTIRRWARRLRRLAMAPASLIASILPATAGTRGGGAGRALSAVRSGGGPSPGPAAHPSADRSEP